MEDKQEKKIFYYNFKKFNLWLITNILLTLIVIKCAIFCPFTFCFWQVQVFVVLFLLSWLGWYYKYAHKLPMAIVTEESIQLDMSKPIRWNDLESYEEKFVRCCFSKRKVLCLIPKKDIDYKYNFLQKHNCDFGPFPIPLYGLLSKEDEETLTKIVTEKVKKIEN